METVVSVNLGGVAYQLEASAHTALKAYLDRADAALSANPDKAEILRDLENAVADKASAHLSAYKNVISAAEMDTILRQMGPVEGAGAQTQSDDAPRAEQQNFSDARRGRRLYRIRERGSMTGVSAGIAAYLDIDPVVVRLLWIVAFLLSGGFALLIYFALMLAVPRADTPAEVAEAHGAPFNAQDVIARAQRNFAEYAAQGESSWRSWRREMRAARREARRAEARAFAQTAPPPATGPASWIGRVFGGLFALVFGLIGVALLIGFLFALFSLITTGAMFDWSPPLNVPIWVAILIVCAVYGAIAAPIHAMQGVAYGGLLGRPANQVGQPSSGFGLLIMALVFWWFYEHNGDFHAWADMVWRHVELAARTVINAF